MPFPLSSDGRIVAETDMTRAIAAVEEAIRRAEPGRISVSDRRIDFTGGAFRYVTGWNLLVPIGSGIITFHETARGVEVRYHISFLQMFVGVTLMVALMFGILPVLSWGSTARVPFALLGLMWLWLFGANYVIIIFRFPSALRRALNDASSQRQLHRKPSI